MPELAIPKIKFNRKNFEDKFLNIFHDGTVTFEKIILNDTVLTNIAESINLAEKLAPAERLPLVVELKYLKNGNRKPIRVVVTYDKYESTSRVVIHSAQKTAEALRERIARVLEQNKRIPVEFFLTILLTIAAATSFFFPPEIFGIEPQIPTLVTLFGFIYANQIPHCYLNFSYSDPYRLFFKKPLGKNQFIKIIAATIVVAIIMALNLRSTSDVYETEYMRKKISERLSSDGIAKEIIELQKTINVYDQNWNNQDTRDSIIRTMLIQMQRLIGQHGVFNKNHTKDLTIFVDSGNSAQEGNLIDQHLLLYIELQGGLTHQIRFVARIKDNKNTFPTVKFNDWMKKIVIMQAGKSEWTRASLFNEMCKDYLRTDADTVSRKAFSEMLNTTNKSWIAYDSAGIPSYSRNLVEQETIRAMAQELVQTWSSYQLILKSGLIKIDSKN